MRRTGVGATNNCEVGAGWGVLLGVSGALGWAQELEHGTSVSSAEDPKVSPARIAKGGCQWYNFAHCPAPRLMQRLIPAVVVRRDEALNAEDDRTRCQESSICPAAAEALHQGCVGIVCATPNPLAQQCP
jgi:hypothetical protein